MSGRYFGFFGFVELLADRDQPLLHLLAIELLDFFERDVALHGENRLHLLENRAELPFARMALGRRVLVDRGCDLVVQRLHHERTHRLALQDLPAFAVDDLALLVHDVVVLENRLANLVVVVLDFALRALDRARDHLGFDRSLVGEADHLHHALNALGAEEAHDFIFERDVEARRARIALTAGAAAQLVVDPARFVPFRADDVQAADIGDTFAELDVDAATRHVGRDRNGAAQTGVLNDLRFLLVVLRVEDVALGAFAAQHRGKPLRFFDRARADEHRAAFVVQVQ